MKKSCAIVCCSDARPLSEKAVINDLVDFLQSGGFSVSIGNTVCFEGQAPVPPWHKAQELNELFAREDLGFIFDISGGDSANAILPYLDYESIAQSDALFFGYSDLTSVINAILAKTGKFSVLYQVRNVIRSDSDQTKNNFLSLLSGERELCSFSYTMLRGTPVSGTAVGGNIRCLLKLAGTEYFPDIKNKLLVLEALGGNARRICAYLDQFSQMKVFAEVSGIILGSFTQAEKNGELQIITDYILWLTDDIPVMKTDFIGHAPDSCAVMIGDRLCF